MLKYQNILRYIKNTDQRETIIIQSKSNYTPIVSSLTSVLFYLQWFNYTHLLLHAYCKGFTKKNHGLQICKGGK